MNSGAMLNAYPDSMGGTLHDIVEILETDAFRDAFRSFYLLPSLFNTDLDRGFSVISYDLNRLLATPEDLLRLKAMGIDLKLDFIVNHLSALSPQFQDIVRHGDASPYRDFFIDWNAFWRGCGVMTAAGYIQPDEKYIREMFFRKAGLPLLMVRLPDGRDVPYWNTFYQKVSYQPIDTQDLINALHLQYGEASLLADRINQSIADNQLATEIDCDGFEGIKDELIAFLEARRTYMGQMDLNINNPMVWTYYGQVLDRLAAYGAAIVRLDAFAYASKIPGRRNFMNEPETWDTLERIRKMAMERGLSLLPEIHDPYEAGTYKRVSALGYVTYDFFLPGLILDAIENHTGEFLSRWAMELTSEKISTVNMLGCHDGIPVLDLKGLLDDERIQKLIDLIVSRGGLIKNLHGATNVYYQVNSTYYSALGANDRKMMLARALQLFMPGKPQVWYLDLFAGKNDVQAVQNGGEGAHKEINRTNLSKEAMKAALARPVVREQLRMLKLRNQSMAFGADAQMEIRQNAPEKLSITWRKNGSIAKLDADLVRYCFTFQTENGSVKQD